MKAAYILVLFSACLTVSVFFTDLTLSIQREGFWLTLLGTYIVKPIVLFETLLIFSKIVVLGKRSWKREKPV